MSTATALRPPSTRVLRIPAECGSLTAELTVPEDAVGVVVFARTNTAHRQMRYDQRLAALLHDAGFATLVFDLLTPTEELVDEPRRALRGDLGLLSRRLIEVVDWLCYQPGVEGLPVGLLGEDAGAAATFVAACVRADRVAAIVSYAERLDQAYPILSRVHAPSLLIVAGNDEDGLRANNAAFGRLSGVKLLVRVGVDRLATAGDKDEEVSRLAFDWFSRTMGRAIALV